MNSTIKNYPKHGTHQLKDHWKAILEKDLREKLARTKWNDPYHKHLVTDFIKEILEE